MYVYMRERSFSVVTWSDNYRGIFLFSLIHSILLSTCWDPPALRVRSYRHSWVKLGKVHIMFPEFSEWIPIVQRKFCIRLYVWMFFSDPDIVFILIFFWPVCVKTQTKNSLQKSGAMVFQGASTPPSNCVNLSCLCLTVR